MNVSRLRSLASRVPFHAYKQSMKRVVIPMRRLVSVAQGRRFEPDRVTVVTVNWNTLDYLKIMCDMVRRHSPPGTLIVVVDNASDDGSREWIRSQPDVVGRLLPFNLHHGLAADVGAMSVRSEYLVLLDVDAFPFSEDWLPTVLEPLKSGCTVAGGFIHREYVHPSFLAVRTRDFVARGHSFGTVGKFYRGDRERSKRFLDAGENLSLRERARFGPETTHFVKVSETRGPGLLGTVFGGVVYHNFFSTGYGGSSEWGDETAAAWDEAVARYVHPS